MYQLNTMYKSCAVFSIKHYPLPNAKLPIHAGWLHCCTKVNVGVPLHTRAMREGMAIVPSGCVCAMTSHKYLSYTNATKVEALKVAERLSKEDAARQFKADMNRIHKW